MMLEELQRRNNSAITTRNYLRVVAEFAKWPRMTSTVSWLNPLEFFVIRDNKW
jgi:hypothetical protein